MSYPRRARSLRMYISRSKMNTLSQDDRDIFILYAYIFSESLTNADTLNAPNIFYTLKTLADQYNIQEKFFNVINKIVENGIQSGMLHPADEENFEEDQSFLADLEYSFDIKSKIFLNFVRALNVESSGTLSKIIYYTFLSDDLTDFNNFEFFLRDDLIQKIQDISKIKFLKDQVELSDEEALILLAAYRIEIFQSLQYFLGDKEYSPCEYYQDLTLLSKAQIEHLTTSNQKLMQFGFLERDKKLSEDLIECLEYQDFDLFFSSFVLPFEPSTTYQLDSFNVNKEETSLALEILSSDSPVSILLYGKPGSGKTEYAKALAKECGKKILLFKNETENEVRKPFLSKLNCLLSLNRPDTILIIDEADSILQTKCESIFGFRNIANNKGLINKMLENSKNQVLWIVNYPNQMDESTRRRFTFSFRFEAMPSEVIKNITKTKLLSTGISEELQGEILSLITKYRVTGSSVDNLVKVLKCISTNDKDSILTKVNLLLKENSRLLDNSSNFRKCVNASYDSSVLNTSLSSEKIVNMVENAISFSEKNWKYGETKQGIRMLFYGLSGTGKTEFARYISQQLGKEILLKRASDILDKYVGGTEQKIADAFSEAAANDQILLLDEADTFFQDRNNAEHSWEISKVNELLTQMEEFPGILICTTNLRNIMDSAMIRRFHISVEFKALEEEGIKKLLENYFSSYTFTQESIHQLNQYKSITPGDFSRLAETIRFMNSKDISSEVIVEELKKIQEEKNPSAKNRVGFL